MKTMAQAHNRKKTPLRISFGKIVREKRMALALSQEKLAEKADLHTNYVGYTQGTVDAKISCKHNGTDEKRTKKRV